LIKAIHEKTRRLPSASGLNSMLLDTAAEGYWLVDADLFITFANETLCRMLGYRANDLVGSHLLSFVAAESLPAVRRAVALQDVRPQQSFDVTLLRSDGRPLYAILSTSVFTDHASAAIGTSIFVTDITGRHADEVALRSERERLADTALRLNRFLELLSANLKDPVSAVLGFAEVLESEATGGNRTGAYAASCREAAQQMARVLDDVAHWARIQADEEAIDLRLFDVAGVVHDVMEWAGAAAARQAVTLISTVTDAPVLADVAASTTVLQHLVDNAIRYSRSGSQVTLSTQQVGTDIEIEVRDQGTGIPAARLGKLFQLDAQHATPDLNGHIGSGMGLMICEALVARMGGLFRIESREGVGTTVTFTLPSGRASAD